MSDRGRWRWTIYVCPQCGGWQAAHFAEAVEMWHNHEGLRVDFEPVEVVPALFLEQAYEALRYYADGERVPGSDNEVAREALASGAVPAGVGGQQHE